LKDFSLVPYEAQCNFPQFGPSYIENLSRLGMLELSYITYVYTPGKYDSILNTPLVKVDIQTIKDADHIPVILREYLQLTMLGKQFYNACII